MEILAQIQSLFYKPSCLPLPRLDFQFIIISKHPPLLLSPFILLYLTQTNSLFFCNAILYSTISLLLTCLNCKLDFYGDVFSSLSSLLPSAICLLWSYSFLVSMLNLFCLVNLKNESRFCSISPNPSCAHTRTIPHIHTSI